MGGYFSSTWSNPNQEVIIDATSVVIEPNELAMVNANELKSSDEEDATKNAQPPTDGTQIPTAAPAVTPTIVPTIVPAVVPTVAPPVAPIKDEIVVRPDRIVALAGHIGSGKDTLATVLEQVLKAEPELAQLAIHRMAFADPIKDIICEQFNISRSFLETTKRTKDPPQGFERPIRELLQHVGDFRTFKADVWVDALLRKLPSDGLVIITDVRYPNELEALKKRGAYVVLLSRHLDTATVDTHSSEQSLLPFYNEVQGRAFPTHLYHPLIDIYLKNDHTSTDTLHAVSRRIVQQL